MADAPVPGDAVDRRIGELLDDTLTTGRTNRRTIKVLAASVIFDVLLSAAFGLLVLRVERAQRDTCAKFNVQRAGELALFEPLLKAPVAPLKPNATPEEVAAYAKGQEARRAFEANLHRYFDPVQC